MKRVLPISLALLFLPAALTAAEPFRLEISLNDGWRFQRQAAPGSAVEWPFRDASQPGYDDSRWSKVFLPHSWDQVAHGPWVRIHHWRGIGWYRKTFQAPPLPPGQRFLLEFEGVLQTARVWVNGKEAGEHTGGYTSFALDVTDLLKPAAENLLAVQADNTNSPDIPPANETNIAIYGGIYRDVWLRTAGALGIPYGGIAITTPEVNAARSTVRIATELRNTLGAPVTARLVSEVLDAGGNVVGSATAEADVGANAIAAVEREVVVTKPALWHPDHPNLYALRSRVYRDGALADELSTRFGIRVMGYIPGKGYTINGEFIQIRGVNRRQDYGYLADALPDAISRRDMEIIKEMGANMVRTAHYVQDKSVLDAADELGLLVWEEIPNIKIYDYSPTPMTENGDSRFTRRYIENCKWAQEEMVRRDRNHPSIIIWGIGDDLTGYPYIEDLRELHENSRRLDPTRWTAGRVYPMLTDVRDPTNGAYFDFRKLAREHPDWKWLWNEWGAYKNERGLIVEPTARNAARRDTGNVDEYRRESLPSELTAAIFQEASWIPFETMPWMATAKWEMFDAGCAACDGTKGIFDFYGPPEERPWGVRYVGGDYRGLSDLWRIPKASYWFVRAQWNEDPFVHIAGHWTWPGRDNRPKMIRIYSTCDEVELFLNGKSLGKKTPESTENLIAEWKSYGMWDERSSLPPGAKLRRGPFVWRNVPYQPGTLKAVGIKGGRQYVDERKTAGEPYQVILTPDRATMRSGGRDAVRIVAVVADRDGVTVPQASSWLSFRAEGPADLLGAPVLDAVWGMAAINVQSRLDAGEVVVTASSSGLKDGRCVLAAK